MFPALMHKVYYVHTMQAYGCIFMVDAAALDRFDEVKDSLIGILQDEKMKGKPVLIFANKQDLGGAIADISLCQELGLSAFLEDNAELARVVRIMCIDVILW